MTPNVGSSLTNYYDLKTWIANSTIWGSVKKLIVKKVSTKLLANSADPDQTAPKEQSDLGLHCLTSFLPQYFRVSMIVHICEMLANN